MTRNLEWLTRRVERLEEQARAAVQTVVEFTTLARVNASGADDFANVAGDDKGEKQRPIRRVAPWGLAGRPVVGVLAVLVKAIGGPFNGANVGIASDKYGPQDLEDGETALYSKEVARGVLLTKDGDNKLASKDGRTVQVNGDDHSLLKTEDLLADLKSFFTAASGAGAIVISSSGIPTGSFQSAANTLLGKLTSGAYKSTKAKNG
jgi:phage gp45-like